MRPEPPRLSPFGKARLALFALVLEGVLLGIGYDAVQKIRTQGPSATMDFSDRNGPAVYGAPSVLIVTFTLALIFPVLGWIVGRRL